MIYRTKHTYAENCQPVITKKYHPDSDITHLIDIIESLVSSVKDLAKDIERLIEITDDIAFIKNDVVNISNQISSHTDIMTDELNDVKSNLVINKEMAEDNSKLIEQLFFQTRGKSGGLLAVHHKNVLKSLEIIKQVMETNINEQKDSARKKQRLSDKNKKFINKLKNIKKAFQLLLPKEGAFDIFDTYARSFIAGYKDLMAKLSCTIKPVNFSKLTKKIENISENDVFKDMQNTIQKTYLQNKKWSIPDPVTHFYNQVNQYIADAIHEYEIQTESFVSNDSSFDEAVNIFIVNYLFFYIEDKEIYRLHKAIPSEMARSEKEIDMVKKKLFELATIKEIKINTHITMFNPRYHCKINEDNLMNVPDMAIINVLRKGYVVELTDTVVRKANVVVNYNIPG